MAPDFSRIKAGTNGETLNGFAEAEGSVLSDADGSHSGENILNLIVIAQANDDLLDVNGFGPEVFEFNVKRGGLVLTEGTSDHQTIRNDEV